jgi:uncharacterized membrane protein YccC
MGTVMKHSLGAPALYSVKNAAASLAALGISLAVGLPMPFWAMTTVYITSNPLAGATRSKAIYRMLGTLLGAAVAVITVPALVEWPALLSLALSAWLCLCLTLSLLDRSPRAYVLMLAGYTAAIIAFPSVGHPEAVFDNAVARVTEIVLGISCAAVAHSVFWPTSVGERLAPRLDAWLGDAENWLRDVMVGNDKHDRDRRKLAVDAVECMILSTHIPYDTSHWREATGSVQALLYRILLLLPLLSGLSDRRQVLGRDLSLEAANSRAAAWLDGGLPMGAIPDVAEAAPSGKGWGDLLRESYLVRLEQACHVLGEARQLHQALLHPHHRAPEGLTDTRLPLRLHSDPGLALLSGLAAGLSLLLVCLFWVMTGWPDGAGAAALVGVFCCLFAAMDNPVPAILGFGGAIVGSVPLAGLYLFVILPQIDGFVELSLVLLPPMLVLGMLMPHPRYGLLAVAFLMGFFSALAIQEQFSADFARFINTNVGQIIGVLVAAGVTATFRTMGADASVRRLMRSLRGDLATLAKAQKPVDPAATLARATDQLALISQRLGAPSVEADTSLREVRMAMNLATLGQARATAEPALAGALSAMMATAAKHFDSCAPFASPPHDLCDGIDAALRLTLHGAAPSTGPHGALISSDPATTRAALVALRRNLFPHAPAFAPDIAP